MAVIPAGSKRRLSGSDRGRYSFPVEHPRLHAGRPRNGLVSEARLRGGCVVRRLNLIGVALIAALALAGCDGRSSREAAAPGAN